MCKMCDGHSAQCAVCIEKNCVERVVCSVLSAQCTAGFLLTWGRPHGGKGVGDWVGPRSKRFRAQKIGHKLRASLANVVCPMMGGWLRTLSPPTPYSVIQQRPRVYCAVCGVKRGHYRWGFRVLAICATLFSTGRLCGYCARGPATCLFIPNLCLRIFRRKFA